MVGNVFEGKPNKNITLKSCKGLELMYKTAKRTETDVQNFLPWAAILTSLFFRIKDWELAFQIWRSSSMIHTHKPVSEFAHGILECGYPWVHTYKQINLEFFPLVTTRVKELYARQDSYSRTDLRAMGEGIILFRLTHDDFTL